VRLGLVPASYNFNLTFTPTAGQGSPLPCFVANGFFTAILSPTYPTYLFVCASTAMVCPADSSMNQGTLVLQMLNTDTQMCSTLDASWSGTQLTWLRTGSCGTTG